MPRKLASPPPEPDFAAHLELLDLATLRPHPRNDGTHPPSNVFWLF